MSVYRGIEILTLEDYGQVWFVFIHDDLPYEFESRKEAEDFILQQGWGYEKPAASEERSEPPGKGAELP